MPEHGTHHRFRVMGCRCDMCTAAYKAFCDAQPPGVFVRDEFMIRINAHVDRIIAARFKAREEHQKRINEVLTKMGIA